MGSKHLIGFLVILVLTGCTSLPQERKVSFRHAVIGQVVDAGTTAVALCGADMQEANPIFSDDDPGTVMLSVCVFKGILLVLDYFFGCRATDWMLGGAGYAAGAWNTSQILIKW